MTYTDIMQSAGKEINPSIFYTNSGTTTTIDYDDIVSAKLYFNTPLVGTVMKGLSVELKQTLPTGVAIYFSNTATFGSNTATQTYGPYYVKESQYNADAKTYTIELYDEFLNTMVDYEPITIAYPTTVYAFFTQLLTELNLTTQIASLPNGTQTVNSDVYDGINYTYRQVLDDIAQATGCCFKVSGSEVSIATLGTTTISIDDDILKNQNIDFGEHYGAINTIVLSRGGGADNIYYPDPLPATPVEFKITDNQLMNDDDRDNFMADIYSQLNGVEYDLYDTELVGYGGFEPLDKIQITTVDNDGNTKTYNSYVFNDEQTFTQGYTETIYTEAPTEAVSDYKVMTTTDKLLNQTNLVVDKVNNQITSTVSTVEKFSKSINGTVEYRETTDETFEDEKEYYRIVSASGTYQDDTEYLEYDDGNYIEIQPVNYVIGNVIGTGVYQAELLEAGTDYTVGDNVADIGYTVYEKNVVEASLENQLNTLDARVTSQWKQTATTTQLTTITKLIDDNKTELESSINDTKSELEDSINANKDSVDETFSTWEEYIRFSGSTIELGKIGDDELYELYMDNDEIDLKHNGEVISKWKQKEFSVGTVNFLDSSNNPIFAFIPRDNGSLGFRKVD